MKETALVEVRVLLDVQSGTVISALLGGIVGPPRPLVDHTVHCWLVLIHACVVYVKQLTADVTQSRTYTSRPP